MNIARDGDKTDHNGTVYAITTKTYVNGKLVITVGARHECPLEGHGTNQVVEGSPNVFAEGKPVSMIGHACSCGAKIVTGSPNTFEN